MASTDPAAREQSGFLLVELLIMSLLLSMALLALLPLYAAARNQNAMAKDITVASSLALDKVEEFQQLPCRALRRGTCCTLSDPPPLTLVGGACGDDRREVGGIRYDRSCLIRQRVADGLYANDSDDDDHALAHEGVAWIEVTVRPRRADHLSARALKPAVVTTLRVCEP